MILEPGRVVFVRTSPVKRAKVDHSSEQKIGTSRIRITTIADIHSANALQITRTGHALCAPLIVECNKCVGPRAETNNGGNKLSLLFVEIYEAPILLQCSS